MSRRVAAVAVVVALALCCCLLHASSDAPSPAGLRVVQQREIEALESLGANDHQLAAVAGEAEDEAAGGGGVNGRMDLELEDYPGSGANDRHSPWWQQRRN